MYETTDYHTKWSKSDRERKIIWFYLCVKSKGMIQMNLQNWNKLTDVENRPMVNKGVKGADKWEVYD